MSKRRCATYIIGTSMLYTSISCSVIFLTSVNCSAGAMGMLFAYLLPAVIEDPRKELRGTIGCISWWAIALYVTVFYSQMNIMLLTACFLASVFVSTLIFRIHNIAIKTGLNLRTNRGRMRVCNTAINIAFYLAGVSLLFAIAWFVVVDSKLLAAILAVQSFACWYYVLYFWNWSIRLEEKSIIITRFSRKREYTVDDIYAIRNIPFGYYLAINQRKRVMFCFTMGMDQSSKLWMIVRPKLK